MPVGLTRFGDRPDTYSVVVKQTYDIASPGWSPITNPQDPLCVDEFDEREMRLYPSDFSPFKLTCDVLLVGEALAEDEDVAVSIRAGGLSKSAQSASLLGPLGTDPTDSLAQDAPTDQRLPWPPLPLEIGCSYGDFSVEAVIPGPVPDAALVFGSDFADAMALPLHVDGVLIDPVRGTCAVTFRGCFQRTGSVHRDAFLVVDVTGQLMHASVEEVEAWPRDEIEMDPTALADATQMLESAIQALELPVPPEAPIIAEPEPPLEEIVDVDSVAEDDDWDGEDEELERNETGQFILGIPEAPPPATVFVANFRETLPDPDELADATESEELQTLRPPSGVPFEPSTLPPARGTLPPGFGTMPPAAGTMPPAPGTMPPASGTVPPARSLTRPPEGTGVALPFMRSAALAPPRAPTFGAPPVARRATEPPPASTSTPLPFIPRPAAVPVAAQPLAQPFVYIAPTIAQSQPSAFSQAARGFTNTAREVKRIEGMSMDEFVSVRAALWANGGKSQGVLRKWGMTELKWRVVVRRWNAELATMRNNPQELGEVVRRMRDAVQSTDLQAEIEPEPPSDRPTAPPLSRAPS